MPADELRQLSASARTRTRALISRPLRAWWLGDLEMAPTQNEDPLDPASPPDNVNNMTSPSTSGRRLRRLARAPPPLYEVWVGIDFGTSSIRAAVTASGRPPEQIPMGATHDVSGGLVASYRLPTAIWFKGPAGFELLGHGKATEPTYADTEGRKHRVDKSWLFVRSSRAR
ncbi:hypothetical protein E5D57_013213 [Metarhizium anisopliae]|nr:hypothetical protein E5D57_013213 [Metarhizium anisopliae]